MKKIMLGEEVMNDIKCKLSAMVSTLNDNVDVGGISYSVEGLSIVFGLAQMNEKYYYSGEMFVIKREDYNRGILSDEELELDIRQGDILVDALEEELEKFYSN